MHVVVQFFQIKPNHKFWFNGISLAGRSRQTPGMARCIIASMRRINPYEMYQLILGLTSASRS